MPEPVPLRVVFEDADVLVVDKPAADHPGAGRIDGTLAAAALAHAPEMAGVGSPEAARVLPSTRARPPGWRARPRPRTTG